MYSKVMDLRAEAENMAGEGRDRFAREVDGLKSRVDRVKSEFVEAERSAETNWDDLRDRLEKSIDDIKQAFKNMKQRFK